MATKGQIAEQVLKIVNGGALTDDAKVTMQEVGILMEHERDALVRKTILENATLGENEIPNEFLSVHVLEMFVDKSGVYGVGGRPYVLLPQMPINLPNDGSIYRVCQVDTVWKDHIHVEQYKVTATSKLYHADTQARDFTFEFSLSVGTVNIGRKFIITFSYGASLTTLKQYRFTFDYYSQDEKRKGDITGANINTQQLAASLQRNADFSEFLLQNDLVFYSSYSNAVQTLHFVSYNKDFSMGADNAGNMDIVSALTKESVITITATNNPNEGDAFVEGGVDIMPLAGLNIQINYPKNKRIYEMEEDILGIKGRNSTTLNTSIVVTLDDLRQVNYGVADVNGLTGISATNLAKMWITKYAGPLRRYGIEVWQESEEIFIKELFPTGGFSDVWSDHATVLVPVSPTSLDMSEAANYQELDCYYRMPNPGVYSNMYDNAISLSGRKYWYRQLNGFSYNGSNVTVVTDIGPDGPTTETYTDPDTGVSWAGGIKEYNTFNNRIYFYGESHIHDSTTTDGKRGTSYASVWMLAKSSSFKFDHEFPLPSDATVDMIKSLVATFAAMRAAKEDLTNDNVDIT